MYYKMFSNEPDLYPLDACRTPDPKLMTPATAKGTQAGKTCRAPFCYPPGLRLVFITSTNAFWTSSLRDPCLLASLRLQSRLRASGRVCSGQREGLLLCSVVKCVCPTLTQSVNLGKQKPHLVLLVFLCY